MQSEQREIAAVVWMLLILSLVLVPAALQAQTDGQALGMYAQWQRLLNRLEGYAEREQILAVNRFVNAATNRADRELWGQEDYWASPREFFLRRAGDCEDFAVTKYVGLRQLGIPEARLRLAHGRIYNHETGRVEPHLVLVYRDRTGREWMLDNLKESLDLRSQRSDIILDYVFNSRKLWLLDRAGRVYGSPDAEHHEKWLALRQRLSLDMAREAGSPG